MATNNHSYVFDSNLEMKDAGLVAADAAATVDSSAKILDLGAAFCKGTVVIDATAVEVDSSNELYNICFQLSSSSSFASTIVTRAILPLGATEVIIGSDADNGTGRYLLHVDNEHAGTIYRYARLYTDVSGTIATGVNYSAHLSLG